MCIREESFGSDLNTCSFGAGAGFRSCMAGLILLLCDSASGPEIGLPGRISVKAYSGKPQNRPSSRLWACRKANFEVFPGKIVRNPVRKSDFWPRNIIA